MLKFFVYTTRVNSYFHLYVFFIKNPEIEIPSLRLQPLDLGIIKNLKDHYKTKLTQLVIENVSGGSD